MHRGLTIGELCWPDTPEFCSAAENWHSGTSSVLLGFVWKAYELLGAEVLAKIDISLAEEQIERSITQYLTPRIREYMSGFEPFFVEQGVYEFETRLSPSAQPPLYDIAFILRDSERVMWPLEAKVLKTDKATSEYVKEIKENFFTCRYAPFSREGAMIGYMLSGKPEQSFLKIAKELHTELVSHRDFSDRPHKISFHTRIVPKGKKYPSEFSCHHLIFPFQLFWNIR